MSKLTNTIKPNLDNITPYKEALDKALNGNNNLEIANAHSVLAKAYFYEKQFQEGIDHFDSAILLTKNIDYKKLNAKYLGMKGMAFLDGNIPEEGYICFEEVLQIARDTEDTGLESDALGSMGLVYLETGDPGLAREKFTQALALADNMNDMRRIMTQKGNLGNTHLTIASAEDAYNCFEDALKIARKLDDKFSQIGYLNNIGLLRDNSANIEETINAFEEVRELSSEVKDINGEINALHILIRIYSKENIKSERTLDFINRILDLSITVQDKKMEMHYNDIKIVFLIGLKKVKDAIDFITSKLATNDYKNDNNHRIALLTNLGNAYYDYNDLENAQKAYEEALTIAETDSLKLVMAKLLGRIGAIQADLDNLEESDQKLLLSIEYLKDLNDNYLLGQQYCLLAMNKKDEKDLKKAEEYCNEAITAYTETNSNIHISKAKELLGYIKES